MRHQICFHDGMGSSSWVHCSCGWHEDVIDIYWRKNWTYEQYVSAALARAAERHLQSVCTPSTLREQEPDDAL